MADEKSSSNQRTAVLSATYSSPSNEPFTATREIVVGAAAATSPAAGAASASGGLSLEEKTKFLQDLRASVSSVQEQVNRELTARMDEDKARESSSAAPTAAVDEAKEEENYGEEVVDEDD